MDECDVCGREPRVCLCEESVMDREGDCDDDECARRIVDGLDRAASWEVL